MAKSKKSPKAAASSKAAVRRKADDGLRSEIYGLARAIDGIAEELGPLYKMEYVAESLNRIAVALQRLATATAVSVIAQHGTADDRAEAVAGLKRSME